MDEIKVCPKMRCGSCLIFEWPNLPCAKHGLMMVPYSEMPIRKMVYRLVMSKLFSFKYVSHRLRGD